MSQSWPLVPLSQVASHRKQFVYIDDAIEYKRCRVQLHAKGVVLRDVTPGAAIKTKQQQMCRAGELLVAEIDAKVGGFGIVPNQLDGAIVSSHYFLFAIDERVLDRRFLDYFIRTPAFRDQVSAQGSTNYAAIRPRDVLSYQMPLPPLNEQRRIVALLEALAAKVKSARELRRGMDVEAEALRGSYLNRLFENPHIDLIGELGVENFSRLNDVVIDVADGPHVTPSYIDKGIPFITVLNVTSEKIDFTRAKFISLEDHQQFQGRAAPENGDVLITKDGTIGLSCFVETDREFSFFVSVALVKPRRDLLDDRFLTWVLRTPYLQDRVRERSRGDMVRHLVLREIRDLTVPMPSLVEQRRIVTHLDGLQAKVDAVKRLQAETAAELEALLPAVLDRAFKGEL